MCERKSKNSHERKWEQQSVTTGVTERKEDFLSIYLLTSTTTKTRSRLLTIHVMRSLWTTSPVRFELKSSNITRRTRELKLFPTILAPKSGPHSFRPFNFMWGMAKLSGEYAQDFGSFILISKSVSFCAKKLRQPPTLMSFRTRFRFMVRSPSFVNNRAIVKQSYMTSLWRHRIRPGPTSGTIFAAKKEHHIYRSIRSATYVRKSCMNRVGCECVMFYGYISEWLRECVRDRKRGITTTQHGEKMPQNAWFPCTQSYSRQDVRSIPISGEF